MTGPKLNEGATIAGERSGTKATAKYVRSSARKARAVLDLIRGLDVRRADEVLQFTERGIARDIRKVLASAVANAANNDGQDPDELYVIACFADEGPTLKRFRPRARGRASRIRKRTCHITVIVARMSDERLAVVQARENTPGAGGRPSSAASRRARVERSRQRAQAAAEGVDAVEADETVEDADDAAEELAAETDTAVDTDTEADTDTDVEAAESDTGDEVATTEYGEWEGSVLPLDDGSGVTGYEIKGNASSMLYHEPGTRYYDITKAEVYFDNAANAEAAGFARAGGTADDDDAADAGDDEETK